MAHEQIYAHTEAALIAVDHQSVSMSHSTAQIWIAGFGCLVLIAACRTSGGGAASSGSGAAGAGTSGTGTTGTAASTGASGSVTGGAGFADAGPGGTSGASGVSPTDDGETCGITTDKIRITEIDVGAAVVNNELDSNPPQPGLMPIAISPIPSGGSRVAWMGTDSMVHITQLDANDQVVAGSTFGLPAVDLQDIYADDNGGVLLLSRNAMGGGNLNCGNINNLCGASASYPTTDPCYDLYMVRFDGTTETWATELTDSQTDNNNRIAIAPNYATVYPVDLSYSSLGNVVVASGGGYWATVSNIRPGQPAGMDGLADVHLLHFSTGTADQDITLASDPGLNDRAPHLASYGTGRLLAAWETSTAIGVLAANDKNRKLYIQALDSATGAAEGPPVNVAAITGNRYQDFRTFPDGSVAYPAPGSTSTKLKIVRVLPCSP